MIPVLFFNLRTNLDRVQTDLLGRSWGTLYAILQLYGFHSPGPVSGLVRAQICGPVTCRERRTLLQHHRGRSEGPHELHSPTGTGDEDAGSTEL